MPSALLAAVRPRWQDAHATCVRPTCSLLQSAHDKGSGMPLGSNGHSACTVSACIGRRGALVAALRPRACENAHLRGVAVRCGFWTINGII